MTGARFQRIGLALALLQLTVFWHPSAARAVEVGDQAPDFLVHSTVGEVVRLSDYQGKKTVLLFFFVRAFGGV
jgi:cytochrome oxidase Cu insertion factor (SCO1/SenC/PrrC family)